MGLLYFHSCFLDEVPISRVFKVGIENKLTWSMLTSPLPGSKARERLLLAFAPVPTGSSHPALLRLQSVDHHYNAGPPRMRVLMAEGSSHAVAPDLESVAEDLPLGVPQLGRLYPSQTGIPLLCVSALIDGVRADKRFLVDLQSGEVCESDGATTLGFKHWILDVDGCAVFDTRDLKQPS